MGKICEKKTCNRKKFLGRGFQEAKASKKGAA